MTAPSAFAGQYIRMSTDKQDLSPSTQKEAIAADAAAAAYYEYHCRLHGAAVIYVAEMFGAEVNPITAMLKSMKRAMAAEYTRDLAHKARAGQHQVISRGYQMGPLPPLGYRRGFGFSRG